LCMFLINVPAVAAVCHVPWLHILFRRHRIPTISDPDYIQHCFSVFALVLLVRTTYDSLWLLGYALCFSITEPSETWWYPSQLDFTWLITTQSITDPLGTPKLRYLHYIPTNTLLSL
jgi:hypothetical protein